MANYKHGVYISETGTSLIPTVRVESALPFVVGTAPINQVAAGSRKINEPVLINSYAEAVKYFGFEAAQVFNDNLLMVFVNSCMQTSIFMALCLAFLLTY